MSIVGMSDSNDAEETLPKRMCAARARSQLGASAKILRTLACQRVTNPHYRSAAPMRTYDTQEVQEALQKEEARKRYLEDHRDSIEAEKIAKQKEAARKKSATAAQACAKLSDRYICSERFTQGSHHPTNLLLDAWSSILEKLCPASLSALEGPSTIARHIINAQLICRECHAAGALLGVPWLHYFRLILAPSAQKRTDCPEVQTHRLQACPQAVAACRGRINLPTLCAP